MENNEFISEYCKALDQCHGQRTDLIWFSTWMASKSPYFGYAKKFKIFWTSGALPQRFTLLKKLQQAMRLGKTLVSIICKSYLLRWQYRRELRKLSGFTKVNIVRTFLYSSDPQKKDPFWGDLIPALEEQPVPLIVLFEPNFSIFKSKKTYSSKRNNFPYYVFIRPLNLIKIYSKLLTEAFKKKKFSGNFSLKGQDISSILITNYEEELLMPVTLATLAYYDCFSNVIERFDINNFYIPFENNPWEKMCILAKKQSKKDFRIIGFQHAVVPKDATNYFLSEYESKHHLFPDLILTTGEAPYKILKSYPAYHSAKLETGCALRYSYMGNQPSPQISENFNKSKLKILIPLDGTSDAITLCKFIISYKKKFPQNQDEFRILEHPNYKLSQNAPAKLLEQLSSLKNISLSQDSLVTNLNWADTILYCGTTVSLEALHIGKPIINFKDPFFNFDPLFQLESNKITVASEEDLKNALVHIKNLSNNERLALTEIGSKYVKSYFFPCTPDSIKRFFPPKT